MSAPLVLNKIIFNELKRYIKNLSSTSRIGIIGFDVFRVCELNNSLLPYEMDMRPPDYCIILDVKFPYTAKHQIIGNICYYHGVKHAKLAKRIHSYIYDLNDIGIKIVASISSGKEEILKILETFTWNNADVCDLSYFVCKYSRIIHFFDPSWLLESVTLTFRTKNISFIIADQHYSASYQELEPFMMNDSDSEGNEYETAASSSSTKKHGDGLAQYCIFFNRLFESFNGVRGMKNPFSEDMNDLSIHHLFWRMAINIFHTMRFHSKDQIPSLSELSGQTTETPDEKGESIKQNRKCPARLITMLQLIVDAFYPDSLDSPLKLKLEEFIKVLKFASPNSDRIELRYKESCEEICLKFIPLLQKTENIATLSEEVKQNMIQVVFTIIKKVLKETFPSVKYDSKNWENLDLFKIWSLTLINCLSLYDNLNRIQIKTINTNQLNNNSIQEMVRRIQKINGIIDDYEEENWGSDMLHDDMAEFAMNGQCSSTFRK